MAWQDALDRLNSAVVNTFGQRAVHASSGASWQGVFTSDYSEADGVQVVSYRLTQASTALPTGLRVEDQITFGGGLYRVLAVESDAGITDLWLEKL